jgi:membrane protein YdbS with pleckstrin-like domain
MDETRSRESPGRDEPQRLDRRVLLLWWTVGALTVAAGGAAVFVAAALLDLGPALPLALTLAGAGIAAAVPPLRYRRWFYALRQRDALISKGAVFLVQRVIPFDRIQFVESRQGPLDRLFGLTQVVLYTAAGRAAGVPGLSGFQAEALREELSRVAGTASV